MTALAKREQAALAKPKSDSIIDSIQNFIATGITKDNVAALEQLVALQTTVAEREARMAFESAFVAMQNELPAVAPVKEVFNRDGSLRFTYAPFEEIMRAVSPILKKHGFAIRFSQQWIPQGQRFLVQETCHLAHMGGHTVENHFAVPTSEGPPGTSAAQAAGSTSTYAKRFALCNALNIVVDGQDDDARALGDYITPEKADELRARLTAVKGDEKKFLALAQAKSFDDIRTNVVPMLETNLAFKEQSQRNAAAPKQTTTDDGIPY